MMIVPHRKHIYGPLRSVMEIYLLYYMQMMFIPHRKHVWTFTDRYGDSFPFLYVDDVDQRGID
jgi:hypothetical protein